MPDLRSGARQGRLRSKKLDDVPIPQPLGQAESPVLLTTNRRRGGAGRGRGSNAAAVGKKPVAAPARPVGGRGRGVTVIDLDTDQPCEIQPRAVGEAAVVGCAQDLILNQLAERVADGNLAMDGGSAEKLLGAEDEATTAPVPERV